jgi:ketosteroid isomerase-like protein
VSEANIEAARQALRAVGRRDLSGVLEHTDPNIELHPLTSVWQQTYRGHAGIEQWFRDVGDLWREFSVDAEGFRDLGHGTLLVRIHWHGRAKEGSAELEGPAAAVVRFHGERMVSIDVHLDEERALASVAS